MMKELIKKKEMMNIILKRELQEEIKLKEKMFLKLKKKLI